MSDDTPLQIRNESLSRDQRWQHQPHAGKTRKALILLANEVWRLPTLTINEDSTLLLTLGRGLPKISGDGLEVIATAVAEHGPSEVIRLMVTNYARPTPRTLQLDLGYLPAGQIALEIAVGPGPEQNSSADWLAISELVIGSANQISLLRARAFHDLRVANEISHFEKVYDHELFKSRKSQSQQNAVRRATEVQFKPAPIPLPNLREFPPQAKEDVYHYAHRLLAEAIQTKPPDFHQRIANLAAGGGLSIASFCCGTAQIEASLAHSTDKGLNFTLVDINQGLLDQAAASMPQHCKVDTIAQDVNALALAPQSYDVAIFVSGVHHIVELEHVWRQVHHALKPGGELWLIGEQIGPNGNRLDAQCLAEANRVFSSLPERYRFNAFQKTTDHGIPNSDLSEATFEGIRSADIEATLARHFLPVQVYKRNCFLWRLVNQAYFDNYDLANPIDLEFVQSMVEAEVSYFLDGGQPTEMHAIYKAVH